MSTHKKIILEFYSFWLCVNEAHEEIFSTLNEKKKPLK